MSAHRELAHAFLMRHPDRAALLLEHRAAAEAAAALDDVEPTVAAGVIGRLAPLRAVACLEGLPAARAAAAIQVLSSDAASALLRRTRPEAREAVFAALPRETAEALLVRLRFPEGTAGALLDPAALALPVDVTAAQGLAQVRAYSGALEFDVFVVDRRHRFLGVVTLRELLASGDARLDTLVRPGAGRLAATATATEVLTHPGWADARALAVVDTDGTLLGALRFDTMKRLAADEAGRALGPASTAVLMSVSELCWAGYAELLTVAATAVAEGVANRKGAP